jgi:hypothetical protein
MRWTRSSGENARSREHRQQPTCEIKKQAIVNAHAIGAKNGRLGETHVRARLVELKEGPGNR